MKKKMRLWEKESNEIFKVKNLCICSGMIKKPFQGAPCTNQNLVAERVEALHFAVWTNQNLVAERVEALHFAVWTNQNYVAGQKV